MALSKSPPLPAVSLSETDSKGNQWSYELASGRWTVVAAGSNKKMSSADISQLSRKLDAAQQAPSASAAATPAPAPVVEAALISVVATHHGKLEFKPIQVKIEWSPEQSRARVIRYREKGADAWASSNANRLRLLDPQNLSSEDTHQLRQLLLGQRYLALEGAARAKIHRAWWQAKDASAQAWSSSGQRMTSMQEMPVSRYSQSFLVASSHWPVIEVADIGQVQQQADGSLTLGAARLELKTANSLPSFRVLDAQEQCVYSAGRIRDALVAMALSANVPADAPAVSTWERRPSDTAEHWPSLVETRGYAWVLMEEDHRSPSMRRAMLRRTPGMDSNPLLDQDPRETDFSWDFYGGNQAADIRLAGPEDAAVEVVARLRASLTKQLSKLDGDTDNASVPDAAFADTIAQVYAQAQDEPPNNDLAAIEQSFLRVCARLETKLEASAEIVAWSTHCDTMVEEASSLVKAAPKAAASTARGPRR